MTFDVLLESQKIRAIAPEMDPLRMGMGWTEQDLKKPQILIESTFGDSHPGSAHLFGLVEEVRRGVDEAGGKAARYFATDIRDGMAQGHDGINYSLASRDTIANLIEIHACATTFDAGVFVCSCDKGVPANLMAIGRLNIPSIVVTGGVMEAGPGLLTLEQIGTYSAMEKRGEITDEKLNSVYTRSGQNSTPNSNATNLHSSQKRCCSFCISSSNASPTFQVQKSIFHQMTKPIQVTVILPLLLAISFSRNDDIHSSISGISNDLIGVIPTIGQ